MYLMLGTVYYEVPDERSSEVFTIIKAKRIPAGDLCSQKGTLYLSIPYEIKGIFERLLEERNIYFKVSCRKGLCVLINRILNKKGLLLGCAVSYLLIFFLSGTVFSFEILNDSNDVKKDIISVLYENGITAGYSLKGIDLKAVERDLKYKVEGISWAGITVKGCKMIIDTVDNIPKPKFTRSRLPSDLVAKENGVIERVFLSDGQLIKPVGSGVVKGDIIVSGRIVTDRVYYKGGVEQHEIHKRFAKSIGSVYGTFERTFSFIQPYTKTVKIISDDTVNCRYITLFDAVIPIGRRINGELFCRNSVTSSPSVFGIKLPISITDEIFEQYSVEEVPISENDARSEAMNKIDVYEQNFLSDYVIKSRNITAEEEEKGIKITAVYTLYGEISEEVEFFVDK